MKKLLFFAVIASLFALASCTKTIECECKSVQKYDDPTLETIVGYSTLKLYKGICGDRNASSRLTDINGPYTVTITCIEL